MKILVIDNADLIAACLTAVDAEIICHSDEIQALNAVEEHQPGLILLNYGIRGAETPGYVRLLIDASAKASVVVLGESNTDDAVISCLLSGGKGYQDLKQFPEYCIRLVRAVSDGEAWVSRRLVAKLIDSVRCIAA